MGCMHNFRSHYDIVLFIPVMAKAPSLKYMYTIGRKTVI